MKTAVHSLILITSTLLMGCNNSKSVSTPARSADPVVIIAAQPEPLKEVIAEATPDAYKTLIFNTKLSVNPKQPNWVLFSNGTYILFPKGTRSEEMRKSASGLLQRYNNESFTITKSPLVKGWIARSKKGIYNYVSLEQAGDRLTSIETLKKIGKTNVLKDKTTPIIVHVNTQ